MEQKEGLLGLVLILRLSVHFSQMSLSLLQGSSCNYSLQGSQSSSPKRYSRMQIARGY